MRVTEKSAYKNIISRVTAVTVVLAVGFIGVHFLAAGHAGTFAVAGEAENGNITAPATAISNNNVSGDGAVKFVAADGGGDEGISGCSINSVPAPCIGSATTAASGWGTPVFSDEFSGTSLNTSKWASSWFNGGTMNDVSTSPSNVSVSDGNLSLTLSSSSVGALINSNPNDAAGTGFQFTTGYAEARVYFPGSGATIYNWPAWWTDGQNWPGNGEIDIAEGLGTLTSNYHSNSGANNSNTISGTWSNGFHTYAVNRQANKNDIYWDGRLVRSYTTDDNNSPQYLIFNVGRDGQVVSGSAGAVKVDYVRVWKK